jgi:hypothetical protein
MEGEVEAAAFSSSAAPGGITEPLKVVALSSSDFVALFLLALVVLYALPKRVARLLRRRGAHCD